MTIRRASRLYATATSMLKYARVYRRHSSSDATIIGNIVRAANRVERRAIKRAMIDEGLNDLACETV